MNRVEVEKFLTDKGYVKLDNGSFVKEDIGYCVHIADSFDDGESETGDYNRFFTEQSENEKTYSFAKKSSILVILDEKLDKNKIRSNVYHCLKIFVDDLDAIPYKVNKEINVTFKEGEEMDYLSKFGEGDYHISPFWNLTENLNSLMKYLNRIQDDIVIIFPRILVNSDDLHYMRYYANKFYNVDTIYKEE